MNSNFLNLVSIHPSSMLRACSIYSFNNYAGVNINPHPPPTPGQGGDKRGIERIWDLHHTQGGGALELFRSVSDLGGSRSGA